MTELHLLILKIIKKKALQGEKIETPAYIKENKLRIDYAHYITNQIMKPVQQVFALVLENMSGFKKKYGYTLRRWKKQLAELKKKHPDKYNKKLESMKNKEVKALLFDDFLIKIKNKRNGNQSIADYFMMNQ